MDATPNNPPHRLRELAWLFLRLGTTAFGGPAAHIALMQEEAVVRRQWLTSQEFLDMLAAANLIPGPTSTELSIHIGYRRAGIKGLIVAGACFIIPAALICTGLAALYVRYGGLPFTQSVLDYVKPVVIAVVGQALFRLGKSTLKSVPQVVLCAATIAALFLQVNQLLALFSAGALAALIAAFKRYPPSITPPLLALPVFTTATFIGYLLAGSCGVLVGTLGIFLPAFSFVGITAPILPRLRQSKSFAAFLDGLTTASLALMAVVAFQLAQAALINWGILAIAALSLFLLIWKNINSIWLILAGAFLGVAHASFMAPPARL